VPCAVFEHAVSVLQTFKMALVALTAVADQMRIADVRNLGPRTSIDLQNVTIQTELSVTSIIDKHQHMYFFTFKTLLV